MLQASTQRLFCPVSTIIYDLAPLLCVKLLLSPLPENTALYIVPKVLGQYICHKWRLRSSDRSGVLETLHIVFVNRWSSSVHRVTAGIFTCHPFPACHVSQPHFLRGEANTKQLAQRQFNKRSRSLLFQVSRLLTITPLHTPS